MRFVVFVFLCFSDLLGYSQHNYLQPDSIYKKNFVKRKINSFDSISLKGALVYNFDKNGNLTDFGLTDNETGEGFQFRIFYYLDSTGKTLKDTHEVNGETAKTSQYYYNSKGALDEIITYDIYGSLIKREELFYNPFTSIQTFYDSDSIIRSHTAIYNDTDKTHYVRFFGFEWRNGKKEKWNYKFKNYYDNQSRLIRRDDSLYNPLKIREFKYTEGGLLILETHRYERPDSKPKRFDFIRYEYW